MKNLILLHQWDYIQWDFLFGTEGKIFSQKEFFIRYSKIYLYYAMEKIHSMIQTTIDSPKILDIGNFQKGTENSPGELMSNFPAHANILLITQDNIPHLSSIDTSRIQTIFLDDSQFLAQVESEWTILRKKIDDISADIILLHLWISRIIIASRLQGYKRDFIDISSWKLKIPLPINQSASRLYIKKYLLKLWLYGRTVQLYHLLWKLLKKK